MSLSPEVRAERRNARFIALWTTFVVLAIYTPILCGFVASINKGRYFRFPLAKTSMEWWQKTFDSIEIGMLVSSLALTPSPAEAAPWGSKSTMRTLRP